MFQLERQNQILEYIHQHQKASTKELAELFDTSVVTIRKDIDFLAEKGLLVKVHGGAISSQSGDTNLRDIPYEERFEVNMANKQKIGKKAVSLIRDNDIIILDSGSTALEIARNIHQQNITVVTNDIKIAGEFYGNPNVKVQVSGGTLDQVMYTLIDTDSCSFFRSLHVNKLFLSCDAVDLDFGISNRSYEQGQIKRAMIASADEVILIADRSKFNKKAFYHICDLQDIDTLVTEDLPEEYQKTCASQGINVIYA